MAAYSELYDLRTDSGLRNKIAVATVVAAQEKLAGTPTAAEASWARGVTNSPNSAAKAVINLVLAANKAASTSAILAASDEDLQTAVDDVVDGLILGEE